MKPDSATRILPGILPPRYGVRSLGGWHVFRRAALNLRMKRGPYVPNAGMRILEKDSGGVSYRVYCDGWGRPIHYEPPPRGAKKPLLESDGQDPDDPDDNLTNQ